MNLKSRFTWLFVTAFVLLLPTVGRAEDSPQSAGATVTVSPTGEESDVRQVRANFSEAILPFGDPRATVSPFSIACTDGAKGTERWADAENWVYDFENDLPAGESCTFTVKPELRTLAGKEITGEQSFTFTTGGVSIKQILPYGETINEDQVFILVLDGEPAPQSVLEHAYFSVPGFNDRIGVRIIDGEERKQYLKFAYYREEKEPKIIIQAKQKFPSESAVTFTWDEGLETVSGIPRSEAQVSEFTTRPKFNAKLTCERGTAADPCIPLSDISVTFSAPVAWNKVAGTTLTDATGKVWKPVSKGDSEDDDADPNKVDRYVTYLTFAAPFPERTNMVLTLPTGIRDDSDRALSNARKFPLHFKTALNPPLAKFAATFGIMESADSPALPVTLRYVEPDLKTKVLPVTGADGARELPSLKAKIAKIGGEQEIMRWIDRVNDANSYWTTEEKDGKEIDTREKSILNDATISYPVVETTIKKPGAVKDAEVVGLPVDGPGFYVVEIESPKLGNGLIGAGKTMYVSSAALVTDLSVHFKSGRDSSMVWVTHLGNAQPVADAKVRITSCSGDVLWTGTTERDGFALVTGIDRVEKMSTCTNYPAALMVSAQKDDDFSFVLSNWNEGIEPWRFGVPYGWYRDSPIFAHTVLARNLVKPGEVVHLKTFIRMKTLRVFEKVPSSDRPDTLEIIHDDSRQRYRFPLSWSESGEADTTWTVPKDAKLGTYSLSLIHASELKPVTENTTGTAYDPNDAEEGEDDAESSPRTSISAGSFRVAEYRVPLMRAYIQSPVDHLVRPESVTLNVGASYLNGGGATKLPVRVRYDIKQAYVSTLEAFDGYTFGNGEVKEEVTRRGSYREEQEQRETKPTTKKEDLILDSAGGGQFTIREIPPVVAPSEIQAELEYRDPVGEIQTVSSVIPLWPSERNIGVKTDYWALVDKDFDFKVAVTDLKGEPVADAPVRVTLFSRQSYSHRKRLVGGFYGYESITEVKKKGFGCEGRSNSAGILLCQIKSGETGNLVLQAETTDAAGHTNYANASVWIRDPNGLWFEPEENDRIDLIPEKRFYEPGDTARFQVRMPFQRATALITLEREGVAEHFVREITSDAPVIEFPVLGSYTPNMYVSALLVRGRIADQAPTALLDLGKPAYRLGIAEIKVGWKAHELKVSAKADRDVYRVRDKAKLAVHVERADGKPLGAGTTVAIAAVDEGLLELMANTTWDLLTAMMGRRNLLVETFTAQMQVIGKRHFGLKSAPQGGGGGSGKQARELFDTLLAWYPSVNLDAQGNATVEVPMNDSLTSFRLVAIASSGVDAFGKGETTVRTTQDLMIFAGVSPIGRENDSFEAEFTLRNTTEAPKTVNFGGVIRETSHALAEQVVMLAPGESKIVRWRIDVPADKAKELTFAMVAKEGTTVLDKLEVKQRVLPSVPTRVLQGTLLQVDADKSMPIQRPADALPDRGGIRVNLAPTIVGSLEGVYAYMHLYPYSCLEQRVSKAVALGDEDAWDSIVATLPAYVSSEGLLKYFPTMTHGSAVLTSYVLAISNEAGYGIPDESLETLLNGLQQVFSGNVRSDLSYISPGNNTLLRVMILEALSRYGKATPEMLNTVKREEKIWPTSTVIDWLNAVRRIPAFPEQAGMITQSEQILRARLNFQGTVMGFSQDDAYWWFLRSVDHDAVRMVLTVLSSDSWKEDVPRMMRGAIERQHRGAWDLTTANAWGAVAVREFVAKYEKDPVTGKSTGTLGAESKQYAWDDPTKGGSILLGWPGAAQSELKLAHQGTGAPWAFVQSLAAIPLKAPLSSGYSVKRTITPIDQKVPGSWSVGDVYRVKLEVESQADRTWVVVMDPIPAGATILGTGLGRDSSLLTQGEKQTGDWWTWPAYEERTQDSFRSYYEYVPKGSFSTEYTVRLNTAGKFALPPTRVEAMYSPEMFGETPNDDVSVQ